MRLFGKVDGVIDRFDRAAWLTPPFDLAFSQVISTILDVTTADGSDLSVVPAAGSDLAMVLATTSDLSVVPEAL